MAQSQEIENVARSDKKESSPEHPPGRKKIWYSVPKIDRRLKLKWGLALLGEERAKEYIAWLAEKAKQQSQ